MPALQVEVPPPKPPHVSHDSRSPASSRRVLIGRQKHLPPHFSSRGGEVIEEEAEIFTMIPAVQMYTAVETLRRKIHLLKVFVQIFGIIFLAAFIMVYRLPMPASQTAAQIVELFLNEEFVLQNSPSSFDELGNTTAFMAKTFYDIASVEEFWLWVFGPLLSNMICNSTNQIASLNNGTSQLYIIGGTDGGIVMRTNRVSPLSCVYSPGYYVPCYPYDLSGEDHAYYGPENPPSEAVRNAFTFNDTYPVFIGSSLAHTIFGRGKYGPGAYAVDLPVTGCANNEAILYEMFKYNWIDQATRIVAVEMSIYNVYIETITACTFYVEFAPSGYIRPRYALHHTVSTTSDAIPSAIVCGTGFAIFLIIQTYWFVRKAMRVNLKNWLRFKFFFLTAYYVLMWTCVVLFVISVNEDKSNILNLSQASSFVSLTRETEQLHNLDTIAGLLLVVGTLRIISFFPFRITRLLMKSMTRSMSEVAVLALVIFLLWGVFSIAAHVTFGPLGLVEYTMLYTTFGTLVVLMFSGDTDYVKMSEVAVVATPIFYVIFMIFMWGVMLNLFVAIIVYSYEIVKRLANDYSAWMQRHSKEAGPQMILTGSGYLQYLWYLIEFKMLTLMSGSKSLRKGGGSSFKALSSFLARSNTDSDRLHRHDSTMTRTLEMRALEESRIKIMSIQDLELRGTTAKRFGMPYLIVFRNLVRRLIFKLELDRCRRRLRELVQADKPSEFAQNWRMAYERAYANAEKGSSMSQYLSKFWVFLKGCCRSSNDRETSDIPSSMSRLSQTSSGHSRVRMRQFQKLRKVRMLKLERILEIMELKRDLEEILRQTNLLFRKHKLDFRRLIKTSWVASSEEQRIRKLSREELFEIMRPVCIRANMPCVYCQDGTEINLRIDLFSDLYQQLVLKQRALDVASSSKYTLIHMADMLKNDTVPEKSSRRDIVHIRDSEIDEDSQYFNIK